MNSNKMTWHQIFFFTQNPDDTFPLKISEEPSFPMMNLTKSKATALVLIGLIKLVSGLAPLLFTKILKRKNEENFKKSTGKC